MTGEIHEFDARVGGGYRMSLFYPADERSFRGKTSDNEDMVNVRFLELAPPRRIVEAVSFVTTDPAFFGEMTMIATFEEVSGGTEVTVVFMNLPPSLRVADNEAGSRLSLEQLARRFEGEDGDSLGADPSDARSSGCSHGPRRTYGLPSIRRHRRCLVAATRRSSRARFERPEVARHRLLEGRTCLAALLIRL
jgi:uncharacterized protein YndB with AHSA1/START domain